MSVAADIADPSERMLADLAELDLSLARHVHACATATEDPVIVGELAKAYQRIARSLRQTLALKAKLGRELRSDARTARDDAACEAQSRVERRKAEIRAALRPEVWNEHEEYPELWMAELDERLDEAAELDGFLREPVEAQIARLRSDLKLPPSAHSAESRRPGSSGGEAGDGCDPRSQRRSSA